MAIEHTVVFRLRHQPGSHQEQDFLESARSTLAGISGVEGFRIRPQVSTKSDLGWQLSMDFADQATYDGYNTHPAHIEFVATRWLSEVEEFQEYDFVDDEGQVAPPPEGRSSSSSRVDPHRQV